MSGDRTGESDRASANGADVADESAESAAPTEVPKPKRGAFPTPKWEIDRATPYTPEEEEEESPGNDA